MGARIIQLIPLTVPVWAEYYSDSNENRFISPMLGMALLSDGTMKFLDSDSNGTIDFLQDSCVKIHYRRPDGYDADGYWSGGAL